MSIVAKHLTKSFDNGNTFALDDVNVKIDQGEFVAVIGLSGAGKSTFLRAINGMNVPFQGSLNVLNSEVSTLQGRELVHLRKRIGFIFQQFNLVKNLSALQNVAIGRIGYMPKWRALTGLFSKEDVERARQALDSVGLKGRYTERVRHLSGGQQQRVAIARALVQDPSIILADEPMASLDPKLSEVVLDILKGINDSQNITIIVNIHVLELARKYARRVIAFRKGQLVFDGPAATLTEEKLENIYAISN